EVLRLAKLRTDFEAGEVVWWRAKVRGQRKYEWRKIVARHQVSPPPVGVTGKPLQGNTMDMKEAVERLNAIGNGDTEMAHVEADGILVEFLKGVEAFAPVVAAYEAVKNRHGGFWYA